MLLSRRRMMRIGLGVAGALGAVTVYTLAAQRTMGGGSAYPSAAMTCPSAAYELASRYGTRTTLVASFAAPAPVIAAWQERDRGPGVPRAETSAWRQHPITEIVSVCYYEGTFDNLAVPGGPPAGGAKAPNITIDTVVILVDGRQQAALYAAGPKGALPIEDPNVP